MSVEYKIFKQTTAEDAVVTYNKHVSGILQSSTNYISAESLADGSIKEGNLYMRFEPIELPAHNARVKQAVLRCMADSIENNNDMPYKICIHKANGDIIYGNPAPTYNENIIDFEDLPINATNNYQLNFDVTETVDEAIKNKQPINLVIRAIGESDCDLDFNIINDKNIIVPEISVEYETNYNFYSHRATTHSIGRFGQGKIDLNCGKLEFLSQDFAWGGNRLPVTIKHQYNSALSNHQYADDLNTKLFVGNFDGIQLGLGWKLNLMQSMRVVSKFDTGSFDYVFFDENGNETYFKEGDQITYCTDVCDLPYHLHEDENGNGMTYDYITRTLTTDSLKYKFDDSLRLIEISNEHSSMHINYTSRRITSVTDGAGRIFAFSYNDNNFLERITAPDNTYIKYEYEDQLLTKITYPDGTIANITYQGTDHKPCTVILTDMQNDAFYKVEYEFTDDKVTGVTEYTIEDGELVSGATASYSYDYMANRTEVTTTIPKDEEDGETTDTVLTSVYSFDKFGSLAGQYTYGADGEKGEMSVTSGINPLPSMSMTANNVDNLLSNHSFNNSNDGKDDGLRNWIEGPQNCQEVETVAVHSNELFTEFGTNFLALQADPCVDETTVYQDTITLPAGDYTFSTYVYSYYYSSESFGNIHLSVTTTSGEILGTSEYFTSSLDQIIRLVAPFTLETEQSVRVYFHASGLGTAHFNSPQLENNNCANNYNMLENSNFEHGINGWNINGDAEISDEEKFNMNNSLCLNGSLYSENTVTQTVSVKQSHDIRETFTLSGWAKAYGLSPRERKESKTPEFSITATINYYVGDPESYTADFSPYTDAWQPAQITFEKSLYRGIKNITISCNYNYNNGCAYFDDIRLFRDNIEINLSESDFYNKNSNGSSTNKEYEELKDKYGNTITSTDFIDGEYGTIYQSYDYIGDNPSSATAGNDLIEKTDARGLKTKYNVDPSTSRINTVTDRCNNKTSYEYDDDGRKTKIISQKPDGAEVSHIEYKYDHFNNLNKIKRCDDMEYSLNYNHYHKLENIGIEGMPQSLISYNYKKGSGRLKEISYANGHKIKAVYNGAGKPMSETIYKNDVEVNTYRYVYDNSGKFICSIDTKGKTGYNYTYSGDRIIRTTVFRTDDSEKTPISSIEYSYYGDGLIHTKHVNDGENTVVYKYEYPENANPIVKIILNGKTVESQSKTDSFGRKLFDEIQTGRGFISRQFSYYAGQVTDEHKENNKLKSAPITNLVSHIVLSDGRTLSYEYDGEERITKVTDSIEGTTEYIYDSKGQLTDEIRNGVTINHVVYDKHGNVLQKNSDEYSYDSIWKDKIIDCCGHEAFRYDAQGNPTLYFYNNLQWSNGRQLVSWTNNDTNVRYRYNMHGVRTIKSANNVIHNYTVDGTNILKETWKNNTLIPIYDNSNNVCGINYNGKTYYFLKNLQNDVIAIMNGEGETVARYQYDAWGCCTTTTIPENTVDDIAHVNPYRYRSYYYDTETNLYYLQSRYYDPNTGRFINADLPDYVATSGGNLYAYCKNNPINRIDKFGYCDEPNGIPNWYYFEDSYDSYSNVVYSYDTKITFDILGAIWNFFLMILVMFGSMIGRFYSEIRDFLNNNPWIEYAVLGILIVLLIISIFVSAPFISGAIVALTGISTVIDIFTFDFSLMGIFELVLDKIIDATVFKKLKNYVDDIKKLTPKQKKSIKDLIDKVKSLAQNIISDTAN